MLTPRLLAVPRLSLPAMAPSAGQKRIACYLIIGGGGYLTATQEPPRDGWHWFLFAVGFFVCLATILRAFLDQSLSRQAPPPDLAQPDAAPALDAVAPVPVVAPVVPPVPVVAVEGQGAPPAGQDVVQGILIPTGGNPQ